MHRPVVVLAARLAASTIAGCTASPAVAVRQLPAARTAAAPTAPIPANALRKLPPGVFYLLAGPHLNELNVWQVSSAGVQEQLTHNQPGYEIDGMGASQQGIILADSLPGYDQLARWTSSGPDWLHPRGHPGEQIAGQAPDISADGKITYLLPPHDRQGTTDSKNFTIWLRRLSDGSPEHIIYQDPDPSAVLSPGMGPACSRAGGLVPGRPGDGRSIPAADARRCRAGGSRWPGIRPGPAFS
jgi:hypothetical protein